MKSARFFLTAAVFAVALSVAARAESWTSDYAAAVKKAKAENKLVLLDFTGSDWCIWCKRIDADVFSKDSFKSYADKNLVLVTVDFPQGKTLPDAVKAQNDALAKQYGVEGFPTLILMDANGKVIFTQTGYEEGGAERFLAKCPGSSAKATI